MSCLKGKDKADKDEAEFRCKKCGALAKKKKDVCKPDRLANDDEAATAAPKKDRKDKEKKK